MNSQISFCRRLGQLLSGLLVILTIACVDPDDMLLRGTVDVIVVDGNITNLAEPQFIKLNRSRADPLTGRFGVLAVTKATVKVVVDSLQVITCRETVAGTYQLPSDFKGQVGHTYQAQITLSNGVQYISTQQVMPFAPPIDKLTVQFNATSLPLGLYPNRFQAGYDCIVSTQDPPGQRNFYRWDWNLWEKQKWCRTCYRGIYIDSVQTAYRQPNGTYVYTRQAVEDCVPPASLPNGDFWNDYLCRSQCWDIFQNYTLSIFDDKLTSGGLLNHRNVAQVPLFTRVPALLEIRQVALTAEAYRFYQLLQQQTQNTGGIADTPPTAIVGNMTNPANPRERVVGLFTASAIAPVRHWLDKKDATTIALGAYDDLRQIVQDEDELYYVENTRTPKLGPDGPSFTPGGTSRFITAPCIPSDSRTPNKPEGWQDR